ncbi:MAG: hypothetical protein JWQ71_3299 [Pedosphaera sp.]|nr:hypothetical protein [Pedosphaera sp.]
MKFVFRWIFRLFILVLILVIAGILLLDTIAKAVAEYRIKHKTGLDVKIGKLEVGILNPKITIENFIVYNSAEFGGSPLIDMPELHVEYDRNALFSHKLHYKLVRLNLAQVNIVENKNGQVNIDVLQKRTQIAGLPGTSTNRNSNYQFTGIDTLNFTLGKMNFMSMKQPTQVDELKMDMRNEVLTDIKSEKDLSAVLIVIMLKNGINPMSSGGSSTGLQHWVDRLALQPKK